MIKQSQEAMRVGQHRRPSGQMSRPVGARSLRSRWWIAATIASIIVANVIVLGHVRWPFLGPAIGFWFIIIHPAYLLYTTRLWRGSTAAESVGYSVVGTLLLLMVAGLCANTVLPFLGVARPLSAVPVVALVDILSVGLYAVRQRYPAPRSLRAELRKLAPEEARLTVASALCVVLAVMGANRLNNGASDVLSMTALVLMVATLILLLWWQSSCGDFVTSLILYGISLGLLLMTSLRGWYVTGHDIQIEYEVFQLTEAHAHWSMAYFQTAFNACLSITILPTEISQVAPVDNPYVYKVFFQVIFALCPVLVYCIARRYWSRPVAILSVTYFIGMPTFFTDMPYINRQEIAFMFISSAVLAITNPSWSTRRRRVMFVAAALGLELSHYSSMYFFIGILIIAWLAQLVLGFSPQRLRRRSGAGQAKPASWGTTVCTVGISSILIVVGITFMWGQLATGTAGSAVTDARSAIAGLMGHGGTRSGDVSNFIIGGKALSLPAVWSDYRTVTFQQRAASTPSAYVSASVVDRYPTPMVNGLAPLPPSGMGRLLADVGISPSGVNTIARNAAAKDEQLFALAGFLAFLLVRRLRGYVGLEVFCIGIGSMAMILLIVALPNLSVDYGVLRGFQEALIVVAPVLVAGSLATFSPFGQTWALRIAAAVCLAVFISTTGLLPQALGGYPPQLNLNNSGLYYDIYYMHPQEEAAVGWLASQPQVLSDGVQASFDTSRFEFSTQSGVTGPQSISDIYPPLVKKDSWVVVGYSTLRTHQATTFYDGDLINYVYPLSFLGNAKDLVYDNGGAEVFK